jgi:hypothetical protein
MRRRQKTSSATMMPLLRTEPQLSEAQLRYMWEDVWPGQPTPPIEVRDGGCFLLTLGGVEVTGMVMPAPVPNNELLGPAATSWLWPDAEVALHGYLAHAVILAGGADRPLLALQALTQVTAVIVRATKALGVYVGGASAVVRGEVFVELAQATPLPISLWVDFRVVPSSDGRFGLFTVGLQQLGLMELEIPTSRLNPGELREWSMQVASYLVHERPDLRHGHTIGFSAGEKIQVAHVPSMTGTGQLAYRLTGL